MLEVIVPALTVPTTLPDGNTIRRAVPDDAAALTHLHLDCWDDAYTAIADGSCAEVTNDVRRVGGQAVRWWT